MGVPQQVTDLSKHLFDEIKRLNDPSLTGDALALEISRAKAVCVVADEINATINLTLDAARLAAEYGGNQKVAHLLAGKGGEGR